MKGRTPTAAEARHMKATNEIGCIACLNMGHETPPEYTLIHHIDGKTKRNAHFKTLGLCDPHHTRYKKTGLHNNLTRWESEHGTQEELLLQTYEILNFEGLADETIQY